MKESSNTLPIEFTGISCVGKSTIIKEIFKLLDEKGVQYDDLTSYTGKNKNNKP